MGYDTFVTLTFIVNTLFHNYSSCIYLVLTSGITVNALFKEIYLQLIQGKIIRCATQHDGGREGWKLEGTRIYACKKIFLGGEFLPHIRH
jgi:hypothetical protein